MEVATKLQKPHRKAAQPPELRYFAGVVEVMNVEWLNFWIAGSVNQQFKIRQLDKLPSFP